MGGNETAGRENNPAEKGTGAQTGDLPFGKRIQGGGNNSFGTDPSTDRFRLDQHQYRTNRLLKDADLKYRAIRVCLPGDDPDIAFLEKHFTIKRDEEKIRRVERLVTAFEDSVRNRIRNHEMAAYKDSLAHRLFREAQEIRKQLDNPNSK